MTPKVKDESSCRWDLLSLGEVMLRLDPGEQRIHTTRQLTVWEGGGEYNVARGLRRCFGKRTAIVTALADNPVGRLVEDLMLQGGVDTSLVHWVPYDGIGREARNGLNFTERGFGPRAAVGCSDRGHTAVSQLQPGDLEWDAILGTSGARWLHSGGIFCALGPATPAVARAAFEAARRHGTVVSYDLNYRESLWRSFGGQRRAQEVNREIAGLVDVLFGNEEDFTAALGFEVEGASLDVAEVPLAGFRRMIRQVTEAFPNLKAVATTMRTVPSASRNGWGAICWVDGDVYGVTPTDVEVLDRVGSGDSFASGFVCGLLEGRGPEWALRCGVAHGALAMSTPGDTSMATRAEVERLMAGAAARIAR
jgi:2-dehydro-3-deoxygluconokinase